jgi:hypothetical protein
MSRRSRDARSVAASRRLGCVLRHVEQQPRSSIITAAGPAAASPLPPVAALPRAPGARQLTAGEIAQFQQQGFVSGLPVLAPDASRHLVAKFDEIAERLPEPLSTNDSFWFFKCSRWIYELTMLDAIHDYVEALLGPDFFLCARR